MDWSCGFCSSGLEVVHEGLWCATCCAFFLQAPSSGVTLDQIKRDDRGWYLVRRKPESPRPFVWACLVALTIIIFGIGVGSAICGGILGAVMANLLVGALWWLALREHTSQIELEPTAQALLVREKLGLNRRLQRSEIDALCVLSPKHKGRRSGSMWWSHGLRTDGPQRLSGTWPLLALVGWLKILRQSCT